MAAAQGATVALPRHLPARRPATAASRLSVLLLPAVFVVLVLLLATKPGSASAVAMLALFGVPLLAGVAAARLARGSRPALAWLVPPLVALALTRAHELGGQLATLALLVLSCVALGTLLARLGGRRALALGAAGLALADLLLFLAGYVNAATSSLDNFTSQGTPGFFEAVLGSSQMGYGDLFVAGVVGAVAAARSGSQLRVAAVTVLLTLAEGALFAGTGPYPVTAPVVAGLVIDWLWRRRRIIASRRSRRRRRSTAPIRPSGLPQEARG